MKVLYLTLKRKWFNLIREGKKRIEYRDMTPYWKARLLDKNGSPKHFDAVEFRNGYSRQAKKSAIRFSISSIVGNHLTRQYCIFLGMRLK